MRNNIAREKMEVSIMGEREYAIICTFVKKKFLWKIFAGGSCEAWSHGRKVISRLRCRMRPTYPRDGCDLKTRAGYWYWHMARAPE